MSEFNKETLVYLDINKLEPNMQCLGYRSTRYSLTSYDDWGAYGVGIIFTSRPFKKGIHWYAKFRHPNEKDISEVQLYSDTKYAVLKSSVGPQYTERGELICP